MNRLLYSIIGLICSINIWYLWSYGIHSKGLFFRSSGITIFNFICINILVFILITFFVRKKYSKSILQSKIIVTFVLIAAIPSLIIALLSIYFCYKNTKIWLDNKIVKVIENSSDMINLYIQDTKFQMKQMLLDISEIIEQYEHLLEDNPDTYIQILNSLADIRNLDEIILFDGENKSITAQTTLGLSLSVLYIKDHFISEANAGNIVEITDQDNAYKIKMMIKTNENSDTYLIVSKFIEKKILNYFNESKDILTEYDLIRNNIEKLQLQFSVFFMIISMLIIIISIAIGRSFTNDLLNRLEKLLIAVENIKNGQMDLKKLDLDDNRKDELGMLSFAFIKMLKQLEYQKEQLLAAQRSSAWSDIARKVAHEINNPLTPIQLSSEILLKNYSKHIKIEYQEKFEQHMKSILNSTKNISVILKAFTNFAMLPNMSLKEVNLYEIISSTMISRKLIFNDIKYELDVYSENIPFICDTVQLDQVFSNIIKNAEEALYEFDIKEKRILVNIKKDDTFIIIDIIDSGPGFDDNLKNKVTSAYFTTKMTGTGLGLGIAEKIITEHFGTMQLSNDKDSKNYSSLIKNYNKSDENEYKTQSYDAHKENLGAKVTITFDTKKLKEAFNKKIVNLS